MDQFFAVKLDNGSTLEVRAEEELGLELHDLCVFRRDFYNDLGEIVRKLDKLSPQPNNIEPPVVQRKALQNDLNASVENDGRARSALHTAHQLVENLGLTMKLLNAHYSLDGKLVIIQFSADGRVDFRELVKELSRALCTRIELRQIGVRDETGIYGGIAVCGQPLCCSRFLKEFNSINVKMAKEQDLSLTPSTISGACGRLKCCLKFEHEGYQELEKGMPKRGEWCDTPQGRGRICDRNLLVSKVSVTLETGSIVQFKREEITVVRPPDRPKFNNNRRENGSADNGAATPGGESAPRQEKGQRDEKRDRRNRQKSGKADASDRPAQPQPSREPRPPRQQETASPTPPKNNPSPDQEGTAE